MIYELFNLENEASFTSLHKDAYSGAIHGDAYATECGEARTDRPDEGSLSLPSHGKNRERELVAGGIVGGLERFGFAYVGYKADLRRDCRVARERRITASKKSG